MSDFLQQHMLLTSLVPAILSIGLAFKFKNVFISLGVGLYSGLVLDAIINGTGFLMAFVMGIFNLPIYLTDSLASSGNAGIIMQILLISGLIYLLTYTGGLKVFAASITKYANSREKTQLMVWIMGLMVFFDDYANALIVGPVTRNITDRAKISREKLAFIIDATAAPIAGIVIISTWIGYEISLISEQLTNLGIDEPAMGLFIQSIPFRFYNILMLIFILITIYTKREFGPMYDAEIKAQSGSVIDGDDKTHESCLEDVENIRQIDDYQAKLYEGIVPLLVLIISSFYFFYTSGASVAGDQFTDGAIFNNIAIAFSNADTTVVLAQAAFLAIIVTLVLSGSRGAFKISEGIDVTLSGASKLIPTACVLLLAWSLGTIMDAEHLNTGQNIADVLGDSIPYQIIPVIIFLISSLMAFATGTSYGTMGILFPLAIPLAYYANTDINFLVLVISAILTGTILGDHCSPISDTTLLSSAGAEVDHLAHVQTQMPYALLVGVISTIGYLIMGIIVSFDVSIFVMVLPVYALLILSMFFVFMKLSKKVA